MGLCKFADETATWISALGRDIPLIDLFITMRTELAQNQLAVEHVHLAAEGLQVQLSLHQAQSYAMQARCNKSPRASSYVR